MAVKTVPEASPEQAAASTAAAPATAEDAVKATRDEYGAYVAAEQIYFGTALGYNPGDPVGKSVVEAHRLADGDSPRVVKTGSAAHKRIRAAQGLPPLED